MKLGATITSERGKPVTKTGNHLVKAILTIDRLEVVKIMLQEFNMETNTWHLTITKEGKSLWSGYIKGKIGSLKR